MSETHYGTLVCVEGIGLMITGEPGMGKSRLALALIDRGHQLVADDAVIISKQSSDLIGKCPSKLQNYLHLRHLGMLNIPQLYEEKSIRSESTIYLIINLSNTDLRDASILNISYQSAEISGQALPMIHMNFQQESHPGLITEILVKQFVSLPVANEKNSGVF